MVNLNNKDLKIKTQHGFEDFVGIQKLHKLEWFRLKFNSGDIECTTEHKFMTVDGWKEAKELKLGDSIKTESFYEDIVSIDKFTSNKDVYDILETDSNEFITNGLISHNCKFMGSSGTLIPTDVLERMEWMNPTNEDEYLKIYQPYDEARKYIAIADPAGGLGLDYSVCTVLDVTEYPYRIVAKYRNNDISPLLFPHTIMNMAMSYGTCPALVESNNDVGGQVTYIMYYELEYENMVLTSSSERAIGGLREGGKGSRSLPGVRTTKKVKSIGCSNLKTLLENDYLKIEDQDTIEELGTFIAKNASYEADDECHDDTVMPLVLFSWFIKSEYFKEYCGNDVGVDLYRRNTDRALEDVMPFGFIEVSNDSSRTQEFLPGHDLTFGVTENYTMSFDQWMSQ